MQYRQLDDRTIVAGQIFPEQMPQLAAEGITIVINNRPDEEEPGQPSSAELQTAAEAAGIDYRHIPVGSTGLSANQVQAMASAVAGGGRLLAFCKSGTRSTFLWAIAKAQQGVPAEELLRSAAAVGYDLTPIRPYLG